MTPRTIDDEVRRISRAARSQAELSLMAAGLLGKCMLERLPQGDGYSAAVHEFHEKFGLSYDGPPRVLSKSQADFRIKFIQEELDEYAAAVESGDLEKQFDAIIDMLYVVVGTSDLQGLPLLEGFQRVHEVNMQKVRATKKTATGRDPAFDIVKPDGWQPALLSDLINPAVLDE